MTDLHSHVIKQPLYWFPLYLAHLWLEPHKMDICKQCRPRSDAAEHGVWSESTLFALSTEISIKYGKKLKKKNTQTPLLLEMDLSTRMGYESPLGINGFKLSSKVTCFCSYSIFAVVERFHCILHEKYCVDAGLHMLVNITKACLYNIEPLKPLFIW